MCIYIQRFAMFTYILCIYNIDIRIVDLPHVHIHIACIYVHAYEIVYPKLAWTRIMPMRNSFHREIPGPWKHNLFVCLGCAWLDINTHTHIYTHIHAYTHLSGSIVTCCQYLTNAWATCSVSMPGPVSDTVKKNIGGSLSSIPGVASTWRLTLPDSQNWVCMYVCLYVCTYVCVCVFCVYFCVLCLWEVLM